LALFSGAIIRGMVVITYPLVLMTGYITKLIAGKTDVLSTSREEISAMASIGTREGIIEEKENKIIQNIFRLKDIKVTEIMTPRVVVTTANAEMSLNEFLVQKDLLYYSRLPIYKDNHENIIGYVFRQEVFEKLAEKETGLKLQDICREIVIGNEFQTIMSLWEVLLEKKEHIALIVDEYGGMAGIVTLEDIIESILGLQIVDERDKIVDMQQFAKKRWNERKAKYAALGDFKDKD
jgi:CBS domain containing-hemolysin-like protein